MVWDAKGVPLAKWAGRGVERDPVTFRRDWLLASLPSDMPAVGRLWKVVYCHREVWDVWDCALSAQLDFG